IDNLRSLGNVYCKQTNYEEAEKIYRQVVELDTARMGGEENVEVMTELNVLAVLLYAQKKL
ncbi:unnamed protein product, partial [Discosporangium mesarthrocarpum]